MEKKLQDKMQEKQLSQRKLAKMLGVAPRTLCNKLQGKAPLLYREAIRICEILDIENPIGYFNGGR